MKEKIFKYVKIAALVAWIASVEVRLHYILRAVSTLIDVVQWLVYLANGGAR